MREHKSDKDEEQAKKITDMVLGEEEDWFAFDE